MNLTITVIRSDGIVSPCIQCKNTTSNQRVLNVFEAEKAIGNFGFENHLYEEKTFQSKLLTQIQLHHLMVVE